MNRLKRKCSHIFKLLKDGEYRFIISGISKRVSSKNIAFGLRRDLELDFKNPDALINLVIRELKYDDDSYFNMDNQNTGLVQENIPTGYVAITDDGIPCYRQWLMGAQQNEKIKKFWGNLFPILKPEEALLENAFTSPAFRGKRIMPAAMARIAEKGSEIGARQIITFVDKDNIPSLKGCMRSGFHPYILRTEKWFLFNRTVKFTEIPKDLMDSYLEFTQASKPKSQR